MSDTNQNSSSDSLLELSIVVPVYGCASCLKELVGQLTSICEKQEYQFEIILVDDRSADQPWQIIQSLAEADNRIKGIKLSRNFGQHNAIYAGLTQATGQRVTVMDCDLQDNPTFIPDFMKKADEGYCVVRGVRNNRVDNLFRRLGSRLFYSLFSYLTDTKQNPGIANFGVYDRAVIDNILTWQEKNFYFPLMVDWLGYDAAEVDITHGERYCGESSYAFWSLISLAVAVILSFSDKPLKLAVYIGFSLVALSASLSVIVFISALMGLIDVTGWASIMLSIWFLGGGIISVLGVVGLYIGRILQETKQRPNFIIEEST